MKLSAVCSDSCSVRYSACAARGDYEAGRDLIETYAVKVDPTLHKEVLDRYASLDIAPYKGFVNPVYTIVKDEQGNPVDVRVDYGEGYADQMLRYSRDYSPLPAATNP